MLGKKINIPGKWVGDKLLQKIMPSEMEVAPLISGWIIFNWASIMVHIGFIIAPKAFKD